MNNTGQLSFHKIGIHRQIYTTLHNKVAKDSQSVISMMKTFTYARRRFTWIGQNYGVYARGQYPIDTYEFLLVLLFFLPRSGMDT